MPRMTKVNAREMLANTLRQFTSITGESIGATFTWHGKLATIGPENFQSFIMSLKDEACKSLVRKPDQLVKGKFTHDQEILELLQGDLSEYNVPTVRRLASWATKQSIGKNMSFWKEPTLKPSFWPDDVEYKNVKYASKESLCKIIDAYLKFEGLKELSPSSRHRSRSPDLLRDRSPHALRDRSPHAFRDISPSPSRTPLTKHSSSQSSNLTENIIQPDHSSLPQVISDSDTSNDSYFPGLRQPESTSVPPTTLATLLNLKPLGPVFQFTPILDHKVRMDSLLELSTKNTFLTDTCMNAFCVLLKNNYPHVQGLQDTILSRNMNFVKAPRPSMQIHHDGALHWVCSSIDVDGNITLYDSMSTGRTSEELDIQLALLYGYKNGDVKISFAPIQKQGGGADCGLFAAAVCLSLANGCNPANIRWRQNRMRSHLSECLKTDKLTPFPFVERVIFRPNIATNSRTEEIKIKLWCMCNLPSFAFNNMVECPCCFQWFHKPCVGLEDVAGPVEYFSCPNCRDTKSKKPRDTTSTE